eukprot:SAG11_NODE_3367_length_2493_cov_12.740602_2_plen_43_part_00
MKFIYRCSTSSTIFDARCDGTDGGAGGPPEPMAGEKGHWDVH